MREAYTRDVAILPLREVSNIITLRGFDSPLLFFQAGMIYAWSAMLQVSALFCRIDSIGCVQVSQVSQ